MKKLSAEQARALKDEGYTFKPHYLYQSEKTAVLINMPGLGLRPFQLIKPKAAN